MRRLRLIHPILLAMLPVLLIYAHNSGQLYPQQLVRPLLLAIGFATLSYTLFFMWLRNASIAAVLASLWALEILLFGHVVNLLVATSGLSIAVARWVISVGLVALLSMVVFLGWRSKRHGSSWNSVSSPMFSVAVLLVLLQVGRIGWTELRSHQASTLLRFNTGDAIAAPNTTGLPDIYFIMLDGYGRSDVLKEMYRFDNSDFLQQLRDWGFHVADHSYANYVGTLWAIASIFNLDYLQNIADIDPSLSHAKPLIQLIRSNRVVDRLHRQGYRIVTLASGYGSAEFSRVDDYREVSQTLNDFEQLLVDTTPLPWIWKQRADAHDMHRRRLRWMLDEIPRLPDEEQPRLVFAHFLAPHPPFVFDRNGDDLPTPELYGLNDGTHYAWLGGTHEEYQEYYAEQIRWVTQHVEAMLESLLRNSATPPVIIVMSDHGPGSELDWDYVGNTNLVERFAVLYAIYLPGMEALSLDDEPTPVNTFRMLFDMYFGTEFGQLPARSYYSSSPAPFRFIDVTDQLP